MASCPAYWFRFDNCLVQNYTAPIPDEADVVVYGGGTMVNWINGARLPAKKKVLWGGGSSRHGSLRPWPDPEGFDLLGVRDWETRRLKDRSWAPCSSCMSSLFDKQYSIVRDRAVFLNAAKPIRVEKDIPVLTNDHRLDEIIGFLAGSEIIYTNSYHGVYWSTLLGRKVVALPYSSKFYGLKHPPVFSDRVDARSGKAAITYPEALDECREATVHFYSRVVDLL